MKGESRLHRLIYDKTCALLDNTKHKHLYYIAEWRVTQRCNLHCSYCVREGQKEIREDIEESVNTILRTKPKILILTGGEPFLINDLDVYVKRIKEAINPKIRVTTNLMVRMDRIFNLLPYLQVLHVSIDGIGDYNKDMRGIDGDFVLKRIKEVAEEAEKRGLNLRINAFVVLTKKNASLEVMRDLVKSLTDISPRIYCLFAAMMLPSNPLSVLYTKEALNQTTGIIKTLKEEFGDKRLGFFSPGDFNRWDAPMPYTMCYRQYLKYFIQPDGSLEYCRDLTNNVYKSLLKYYLFESGSYRDIIKTIMQIIWVTRIKKYHPLCLTPCECEEHIDCFFRQKERGHWSEDWAVFDFKPLPEVDKDFLYRFIRKNINKDFPRELIDLL